MDPVYGYEAINVEAQQSDPSSLLNWMRNMIALRKLFRVFGRGTLEFLHPANRKVLAYLRRYEDEQVLCVANLSRFAQPVELDLSALAGMLPVEMLGYVEFPLIRREPYRLTLGPYGFMWFEFHGDPRAVAARRLPDTGGRAAARRVARLGRLVRRVPAGAVGDERCCRASCPPSGGSGQSPARSWRPGWKTGVPWPIRGRC